MKIDCFSSLLLLLELVRIAKDLRCKMLQSLMEEVAVVLNGQIGLLWKPHELAM